jgi:hypothetical protein
MKITNKIKELMLGKEILTEKGLWVANYLIHNNLEINEENTYKAIEAYDKESLAYTE